MKPKGHKRGCKCVVCSHKTTRKTRRNHGYENQAATLHERAAQLGSRAKRRNSTVMMPGTVRSRSAMGRRIGQTTRINPAQPDTTAAHELAMFIDNEGKLYPQKQAVQKNLVTKMKRGTYRHELAAKGFQSIADAGARMYTREMGASGPHGSFGIFDAPTRRLAASMLANDFHANAVLGEYDYLLPKKYQANPIDHYPRTSRGPKGKKRWYMLDLYDGRGNLISTRIRSCARAKCATEAAGLVDRKAGTKMVRKVELSGPYSRKPTPKTARK